jgi:galactarate dehydratase
VEPDITDGTVGTKNLLGISTSVQCVAGVVEFAARRIRDELLPRYPNVDDVVALTHTYGCGVAINAPGADVPIRTLRNMARNPNFGGALMVVGLGCEKMMPEWLLSDDHPMSSSGNTSDIVGLQDDSHLGFGDMVASILEMAEKRLIALNRRTRTTCPASDLVVGTQCGGSDAFSGVTANPAIAMPPICWFAPGRRSCFRKSPRCLTRSTC